MPQGRWHGPQRRIGLTGGIATGKSSVGRHLTALDIPVLDADRFAHDALAPGSEGETAVLQRYGSRVLAVGGASTSTSQINRKALGSIVFNEPDERLWLEQLVHPFVRACFDGELLQLSDEPTVVLMIPLLFEADLTVLCSEIWVVHCRPEQQLERLQHRDGISRQDALAMIKVQWPIDKKAALSDVVINNSCTQKKTMHQVDQVLNNLHKARGQREAAPWREEDHRSR